MKKNTMLLFVPLLLAACDNNSSLDKTSTAKAEDNMQQKVELQDLIRQVKKIWYLWRAANF